MAEKSESSNADGDKGEVIPSLKMHKDLSIQALQSFKTGKFDECLTNLNELVTVRQYDIKVLHNIAVAEFYRSGLTGFNDLKYQLSNICNTANINLDDPESLDNPDYFTLYYNLAVLNYHLRQYPVALSIVNKLFTLVEKMTVELARKVVMLSIELYLVTKQPDHALVLIEYLKERPMMVFRQNSDSDVNDARFKLKMMEYKVYCYLNLGMLSDCERELAATNARCERVIQKVGYESDEMYEARCLNRNYTIKILRAYYQYHKHLYKQCIETLTSIPLHSNYKLTGESVPFIVFNNLGIVHLKLQKYRLASVYLQKAVTEYNKMIQAYRSGSSNNTQNSGRPLYTIGTNRLHLLKYNIGLNLLACDKPEKAFDYFLEVIVVYNSNPKLWLRLAECCILAHKVENTVWFDCTVERRKQILQAVIGKGSHRKLLLNLSIDDDNDKYSYDAQSYAIPVTSLEFSTLCLRNALLMLSDMEICYAPSDVPLSDTKFKLQAAVCVAGAYVSLCIGDPLNALYYSKSIHNATDCPAIYRMLSRIYRAEAMLAVGDNIIAYDEFMDDFAVVIEKMPVERSLRPYKPDDENSARVSVLYNLAVTLVKKGEIARAAGMLKQLFELKPAMGSQFPLQVICLALYMELLTNRVDLIKGLMKQNCPQYFPLEDLAHTVSK